MARESFEDLAIAEIINHNFVPVKVDRERRPDIDALLIAAAEQMIGQSGWPLTVILTPKGKPFFATTYLPRDAFQLTIERVAGMWSGNAARINEAASVVLRSVETVLSQRGESGELGKAVIEKAVAQMVGEFDELSGGFGDTAKFPRETWLRFLQERALRDGDPSAGEMVAATLDAMAQGGIHDQVGGGFHRYTVDPTWEAPHFEKMLYNQAAMALLYLREWRRTGRPFYRYVAEETFEYALREMRGKSGGFHAAVDAESEGEEGLFYLWTPEQIRSLLAPEDAQWALRHFGVTEGGNFDGRTVLHLNLATESGVADEDPDSSRFLRRLKRIRSVLQAARSRRPAPHRDEKVLLGWNGLMISALAEAYADLGASHYLEAAVKAAEYLWSLHRQESGAFWRVSFRGRVSTPALLEDYALFAEGLVALYDQTLERRWLARAEQVVEAMLSRFWDAEFGGLFRSPATAGSILAVRVKSARDETLPSGNAVAARLLTRLFRRTGRYDYRDRADRIFAAFAATTRRDPAGSTALLGALAERDGGELGHRVYAAQGKVSATGRVTGRQQEGFIVRIRLRIAPGWHINAHQPLQQGLIATELAMDDENGQWRLQSAQYPAGVNRRLGFQSEPLALYEGAVTIDARVVADPERKALRNRLLKARLRIQACSDRLCLQPEWLTLRMGPVPAAE
ncbi:MAG: thioredoxin domain-containing protein [Gammaproteobacteria bacterium]